MKNIQTYLVGTHGVGGGSLLIQDRGLDKLFFFLILF